MPVVSVLCEKLLTWKSSVVSLTAVVQAVLASLLDATQERTCILAIQSQGIIVIKYKNMLGQNLQSNAATELTGCVNECPPQPQSFWSASKIAHRWPKTWGTWGRDVNWVDLCPLSRTFLFLSLEKSLANARSFVCPTTPLSILLSPQFSRGRKAQNSERLLRQLTSC